MEAYESTNLWLRLFCFSGKKKRGAGFYEVSNNAIPAVLLAVSLVGVDFYCSIVQSHWKFFGMRNYVIIETLRSAAMYANLVITILAYISESETVIRTRINLLTILDESFGSLNPDNYKKYRRSANVTFFVTSALRAAAILAFFNSWVWRHPSVRFPMLHISRFLIVILLDMNYMHHIVSLCLLKARVSDMRRAVDELVNRERSYEIRVEYIQKIKSYYLNIYEYCRMFSTTQGLQIMLDYCFTLNTSVITIAVVVVHTVGKDPEITTDMVVTGCLYSVSKVAMLALLLVQATSITEESSQMSSQVEGALVRSNFGSESSRREWKGLLKLAEYFPLQLSAYDFLPLDYSLLVATFASVATYAVILVQLN